MLVGVLAHGHGHGLDLDPPEELLRSLPRAQRLGRDGKNLDGGCHAALPGSVLAPFLGEQCVPFRAAEPAIEIRAIRHHQHPPDVRIPHETERREDGLLMIVGVVTEGEQQQVHGEDRAFGTKEAFGSLALSDARSCSHFASGRAAQWYFQNVPAALSRASVRPKRPSRNPARSR